MERGGEHPKILEQMLRLQQQRRSKQPLDYPPSAGSTFKRPPGYYVGGPCSKKRGAERFTYGGGAEVSRKHAGGFLIKVGEAKARDFLDLIAEIQSIILAKHGGVHLEPEVRVLGED